MESLTERRVFGHENRSYPLSDAAISTGKPNCPLIR
jgi:hypothetical protein